MAFPKSMTVSVSKGNKGEGSLAHTHRKEVLKKMTKEKQEAFLSKKGHTHIKREYIDLNEDQSQNIMDLFNSPAMEKSLIEYNQGKRKSRQIGKGEALTCEEKKKQLQAVENVQSFLRLPKKDQQAFLDNLSKEDKDACFVAYKKYGSSLRDLQKAHTKLEHTDTLGEAYYKKLVKQKGKKGKLYSEFVIQIGNAADYNKISDTGEILESYDRRDPQGVWQQAKQVYRDYLKNFNKRNKSLAVLGYSIHMDEEGAPHVHLDLVGIGFRDKSQARGKTRKNGPSIRIGFNSALEAQGFKVDHERPEEAFSAWQAQEQEALADSMKRVLGVDRKLGKTNNFENIHEYKEYKAKEAEERARLAEVTKQVEEQEKKKTELESSVKDLEAKQAEAQVDLAKATQLVEDANNYVASEKAKIASERVQLEDEKKTLKDGQKGLEREQKAFKAKQDEEGDLDVRIQAKRKTLKDYTAKEEEHKNAIYNKKKKELDDKLAKKKKELDDELDEYRDQVDKNKKAYINYANRQYRERLDRREKELAQREKKFTDKIKRLVNGVRVVYMNAGLQSICKTKREALAKAKEYVKMDKDQQKALEKQAFSGAGGLYRKLSAFHEAVDYLFHGGFEGDEVAPDAAKLSPLQPLKDLADEAESDAKRYENMKQEHAGLRNPSPSSPSRSAGPEL